jgi:adenosine/AMP kinase
MYPIIKKLIDEGYPIEIIDTKINKEASKKYNINALPTIIILNGTQEIKRLVGVVVESEIRSVLKIDHDYRIW